MTDLARLLCESWPDITKAKAAELAVKLPKAYPGVDIEAELHKAVAWEASNRSKRNHRAFFNNWLSRAAERQRTKVPGGVVDRERIEKTQKLLAQLRKGEGQVD